MKKYFISSFVRFKNQLYRMSCVSYMSYISYMSYVSYISYVNYISYVDYLSFVGRLYDLYELCKFMDVL